VKDRHNVRPTIESLCGRWPACFKIYERQRRPLKLRIDQDIAANAPGEFTPDELEAALRFYTGNFGYLLACREDTARIDLDGNVVGTVTKDESEYAAKIIARRRSKQPSPTAKPVITPPATPRKLSLADLREAARARKAVRVRADREATNDDAA
jgi:sRNA-binding protein